MLGFIYLDQTIIKDEHNNNTIMKRILLFLTFYISVSTFVFATLNTAEQKVFLNGLPYGSINIKSNRYDNISQHSKDFWLEKTYGLIVLGFDQNLFPQLPTTTSIAVTVSFDVVYEKFLAGEKQSPVTLLNQQLKLTFDKGKLISTAYLKIDNALKIVVSNIQVAGSEVNFPGLYLKGQVNTESYKLGLSQPGKSIFTATPVATDGNLPITWSVLDGAESYELEWTYVSDQDETSRIAPALLEVSPNLFSKNSSRVEVSQTFFNIPLVYEKGVVLYRLRALGKGVSNNILYTTKTNWTTDDASASKATDYMYYVHQGLENDLNWQSTINFAEEGKTKLVVNYFDGNMHSRQVLSRINADKRAIVGETFYDYNGRPVIQLLPVPVKNQSLAFRPVFNLIEATDNSSGTPIPKTYIDKSDYDSDTNGNTCSNNAPPFATTTGASQYYSSKNDFNINGNTKDSLLNKALIPDAEKFPYTQTKYTADNTGRVLKQAGVGAVYNLNTTHITKNKYSSPGDNELSRLFGSDIGKSEHYKKNIVMDPNGQASVSYLDLDGKVVATALAGPNITGSLQSLNGDHVRTITDEYLRNNVSNQVTPDQMGISFSNPIVVTGPTTTYGFNYSATAVPYDVNCSTLSNPAYFDGPVAVRLKLENECKTIAFDTTIKSASGSSNQNQALSVVKNNVNLSEGKWTLTKTFTVNENALNAYWEAYLKQNPNCIHELTYYKEIIDASMSKGICNADCEQCNTWLDSLKANNPGLSLTQIDYYEEMCGKICQQFSPCQAELDMMVGDLNNAGQYGLVRKSGEAAGMSATTTDRDITTIKDSDAMTNVGNAVKVVTANENVDNAIDPSAFPLSVFNVTNDLVNAVKNSPLQPNWKNPFVPTGITGPVTKKGIRDYYRNLIVGTTGLVAQTNGNYYNADGTLAVADILVELDGDSIVATTPKIDLTAYGSSPGAIVFSKTATYKIPLKYLSNVADFINLYWQEHFSYYYLPYHPEFKYFLFCRENKASFGFDFDLNKLAANPETGTATNYLIHNDPLLVQNTNPLTTLGRIAYNLKSKLLFSYKNKKKLESYVSEDMCSAVIDPCSSKNCDAFVNDSLEWSAFKALYLSEKNNLMKNLVTIQAVDQKFYNGCIGNIDFQQNPEATIFNNTQNKQIVSTPTTCTRSYQDCFINALGIKIGCKTKKETYSCIQNSVVYTIPFNDPEQMCYNGKYALFEKKQARFFPCLPLHVKEDNIGTKLVLKDSTIQADKRTINDYVEEPDSANLSDYKLSAEQERIRQRYELCGQCPLAAELEDFLFDVVNVKKLSSSVVLTCPFTANTVTLGSTLKNKVLGTLPANSALSWVGQVSVNKKTITGSFAPINVYAGQHYNPANALAEIVLQIPASALSSTFDDLIGICCLDADPLDVTKFTFKGKFKNAVVASGNSNAYFYELTLNGVINMKNSQLIDLLHCSIKPQCVVSEEAKNLYYFLNTLCASTNIPGATNKINQLNQPMVNLTSSANIDFYFLPLMKLTGLLNNVGIDEFKNGAYTASWNWQSNSGTLTVTKVAGNVLLGTWNISFPGFTTSLTEIQQFKVLRPNELNSCSNPSGMTCADGKVFAQVLLKKTTGYEIRPIVIEALNKNMTICRKPIAAVR